MTAADHDAVSPAVQPNLSDYPQVYAQFSWDRAREGLSGLPGGRGVNIAHEAVDRHAAGDADGYVWFLGRGPDPAEVDPAEPYPAEPDRAEPDRDDVDRAGSA